MKTNKGILAFIIIAILGIFLYIPKIYQSYQTLNQLKIELKAADKKSEDLSKEMNDLNFQLENFDNLYYVEKFVRDHLDMKKKDETIYRVIYEEEQD